MKMISAKKNSNFQIFEKMIKTCLLPDKMFYSKKSTPTPNNKNIKDSSTNINKTDIKK